MHLPSGSDSPRRIDFIFKIQQPKDIVVGLLYLEDEGFTLLRNVVFTSCHGVTCRMLRLYPQRCENRSSCIDQISPKRFNVQKRTLFVEQNCVSLISNIVLYVV